MDDERKDLLLDQTASEILSEVFDVDHVFPTKFLTEEEKNVIEPSKRTWLGWLASCLGFRGRDSSADGGEL
jgi:hypothetical protein